MQLQLQPTMPIALVLVLFLVPAVLTVLLYRQHRLPRPWHLWLPGLRLLAFAVLAAVFLQPVLIRKQRSIEQGHIAVLLDNSGSMSVGDDYTLPEQVDICWRLGLFPQSLRVSTFTARQKQLAGLETRLSQAQQEANTWEAGLRRQPREPETIADALSRTLELLQQDSEAIHAALVAEIDAAAYLKSALAGKPAAATGPDLPDPGLGWTGGGGLLLKRWNDLPGNRLDQLTNTDVFSRPADHAQLITSFATPQNVGNDFGCRIQGYLRPPLSGEYVFLLASDDEGQLLLSPDSRPDDKQTVASCPGYSRPKDFDKYTQQTSSPMLLEAREVYYVEARYKEKFGDDHLRVGWIRPDGKREIPIPGKYLSPYAKVPRKHRGPSFRQVYEQYETDLAGFLGQLQKLRDQVDAAKHNVSAEQRLQILKQIRRDLGRLPKRLTAIQQPFEQLQAAADVELATADMNRVDRALSRFNRMKRRDLARHILLHRPVNLLQKLASKGPVQLFSLMENSPPMAPSTLEELPSALPQTNLGTRVQDIFRYYEDTPVSALLVISDGNNNAGKSLREAKEIAAEREVPIFGIGVGAGRPPKDIAIDHVVSPQTAFRNNTMNVSVVVKRNGFTDRPITVKLVSDQKSLHHKVIPPGTENRITVDMAFVESRNGILQYWAEAEIYDTEELTHNNRRQFQVNVLRDPIKTLLVDSFPRWETRFLSRLLEEDVRADQDTLFLASPAPHPPADTAWKLSREQLFAYQVLILGDVDPTTFTPEQLGDIHDFVVSRGGTIIFLAGPNYMPDKYLATDLADLLPLRLSERPETAESAPDNAVRPRTLQVVDENRYDPLIQIGPNPAASAQLWEQLLAMTWVNGSVTASRAADRLVETKDQRRPVVLKANVGQGKVLYLGSDTMWRWHYRGGDEYYRRFWNQVLLWAGLGRTVGTGQLVKLMTSRPAYTPGETVEIHARILDAKELPLRQAQASAEIFSRQTGKIVKIVELDYVPDSSGKYLGRVPDLPRGKYRIIPIVEELADQTLTAETFFEIRDLPTSEYVELQLNDGRLRSFAAQYRPFYRSEDLLPDVPERRIERIQQNETELWDSFFVIFTLALILALEWFLRRRHQLL